MLLKSTINRIKDSSFLRNFSVLTLGEVISRAINMLINIILARALAPELYGKYALLMTYIALFYTVSSLGLQQIVIRTIARNQTNSKPYFYLSLILRSYGYILSVVVFLIYNFIHPTGFSQFLIFALLLGVFLNSFWDAFQNVAFGMERMEWTSIINVTMSVFLLIAYLIIPKSLLTIEMVITIFLFANFGKDLFYFISLYKTKLITGIYDIQKSHKSELKNLFVDSIPYYTLAIFTLFSSQFPILFLQSNSGTEEVAFFNTANKLLLPMSLLLITALNALFPNQSKLFIKNKDAFADKVRIILIFLVVVGVFGATVVSLFRNEVVHLLYGEAYKSTGDVLAYQCWYVVFYAIFCFIGGTYGAANQQKLVALTSIVYAIISVPILWYASHFGARGLAIGYIIASIINMTYCYYYLLKTIDFRISNSFTWKLFLSLFFAFCIINLIPSSIYIVFRIAVLSIILIFMVFNRNWFKKLLAK